MRRSYMRVVIAYWYGHVRHSRRLVPAAGPTLEAESVTVLAGSWETVRMLEQLGQTALGVRLLVGVGGGEGLG